MPHQPNWFLLQSAANHKWFPEHRDYVGRYTAREVAHSMGPMTLDKARQLKAHLEATFSSELPHVLNPQFQESIARARLAHPNLFER